MISLIIVNYNQEAYLRQAITSVLEQTKRDWELLIWDDGSKDNSVAIARKYQRQDNRIRVVAAPHQGVAQARKQAIAETTGEYLGCLDSDDWLADTALTATSKLLDNNRAIGMVYTDYYDVDRQGKVQGIGKRCHIPYSPHRLLVDFMTFHFRLIRRQVYEQIGGINSDCEYAYDYDLCLRLSEVTQIERIHKPLYYYRHHGQNISDRNRSEQTKSSQQAVEQALQRRGLADTYMLQVKGDRFNLHRKHHQGDLRRLNLLKKTAILIAAIPLSTAIALTPASAQQIIPNNDGTMTIVTQDGSSFNIDGGKLSGDGKNLFHSFREFGLDTGEIANFLSNTNIQNILGRINGGNPSIIDGLIQVTGGNSNLFLMNPSGIIFGNNATLNVPGDFTATTATGIGFGDNWFNAVGTNDYLNLVGNPDSFNFANAESGVIINAGDLQVAEDSNISLTGGKVINTGTIETEGGKITVAAIPGTNRVRISQEGQLLSLEVPIPQNSDGEALPIRVTDLPNLLRGLPVDIDTGLTVAANNDVTVTDSNTVIPNQPGTTIVSGTVDASNTQTGSVGGEAHILGGKVGLIDADVDASGDAGGGEVLVGGDYKGQGTVPNAEVTLVDSNSTIKADALENGDGGEVIVWSDGNTAFNGNISARGGAVSGDGGFVEVSGKQNLAFNGNADLSADFGLDGTILLDPQNIFIVSIPDFAKPGEPQQLINDDELEDDGQILAGDGEGTIFTDFTITAETLENLTGEVVLQAQENIEIQANVDFVDGGSIQFTADAPTNPDGSGSDGSGSFIIDTNGSINTNNRPITMTAADVDLNGVFDAGTGNITFQPSTTNSNIGLGDQATGAFNLDTTELTENLNSSGTITIGSSEFAGNVNINPLDLSGESYDLVINGTTELNGDVTTPRDQTYNSPVILNQDTILTGQGTISFNSSINSDGTPRNLIINANPFGGFPGTINFGDGQGDDRIGGNSPLANLRANLISNAASSTIVPGEDESSGTTNINIDDANISDDGSSITTTENQTYSNDLVVESNNISLTTDVDGNGDGAISTRNISTNRDINLIGNSNAETGVLIDGNVDAGGGNITITGTSVEEDGVFIRGQVTTSDEGAINVKGTSTDSIGIETLGLDGGNTQITTADGEINLTGTSTNSTGVSIQTTNITSSDSNVTLTGDEINLLTGTNIAADTVTLQPETSELDIAIAPETASDTTLDITQTELDIISADTASVTIGRDNSSGTITVANGIDINNNLTLRSPETNGAIAVDGEIATNGNDITLNAGNNVDINQDITTDGAAIAINSEGTNGTIDTTSAILDSSNGGDINLTATGNIATGDLISQTDDSQPAGTITVESSSGAIDTTSGFIQSGSDLGEGGDINLTAQNNISTGSIVSGSGGSNGGDITLQSEQGAIDTTAVSRFSLLGNQEFPEVNGVIASASLNGDGGEIQLSAAGNITTGTVFSSSLGGDGNGGNITLTSENGTIDTTQITSITVSPTNQISGLDATATNTATGGAIALTASGNISTQNISTSGNDLNISANDISTRDINTTTQNNSGGNITLNSSEGAIAIGDINSSGTTGGEIDLDSATTINTGDIDSSGSSGIGGDVTLNSGEEDNIRVGSIRAAENNNNGGDIQVNVDNDNAGLFFADSSFSFDGVATSILTNSSSPEAIAIRHGGNGEIPFEVANPDLLGRNNPNGTVGAIIGEGNSQIDDGSLFFTTRRGNIRIISVDSPDNNKLGNFDSKISSPVESVATATNNLPKKLDISSIPEAKKILREIEQQAAQKPALVYINFTSPEIKAGTSNPDQDFAETESRLTSEYQKALGLLGIQVEPTISFEAQPTDKLEILVITPEGEPIFVDRVTFEKDGKTVDVTRKDVETQAQDLYIQSAGQQQDDWEIPAEQLYEWLIASIEEQLEAREIDNLLFVLPPKLRSLPLAALYDWEQDRVLVEKGYNIGLAPSINLMNTTYNKDVQQASVLALGASKFEASQNQKDLNAVEVELPQIVNLRGGKQPILNEQFTLENLQNNLDRNSLPIIHLSTHANFDTDNIDDIYIQLYNQKLTLNELRSLDLKIGDNDLELLVLSACRSAFGDIDAELGFSGLAVKVGVKTAVGSLWKVSDLTTPSLMIEFYHQLKTSPFKAEALRLAQVAMRNKEIAIDLQNRQMITSWGEVIELPDNVVADSLKSYIGEININKIYREDRQDRQISIRGENIELSENVVAKLLASNTRSIKIDKIDLENRQLITTQGQVIELPDNIIAKLLDKTEKAIDLSNPYYWAPFTIIGSPW